MSGDLTMPDPRPASRYAGATTTGNAAPRKLVVADFIDALGRADHPYAQLASVLLEAYKQAAFGKGALRHANELPFPKQRMQSIAQGQDSNAGLIYQVCKKAQESAGLAYPANNRELQGVIVYAAGAAIFNDWKIKQ